MKYSHSTGKIIMNGTPKQGNMNAFIYGQTRSNSRVVGSKKVRKNSKRGSKLPR